MNVRMIFIIHKILVLFKITRTLKSFLRSRKDIFNFFFTTYYDGSSSFEEENRD